MHNGEEDDDQAEGNEPQQQELKSEYSNSWGGSQYELEEHEADEEEPLEYLDTDDTPEGERTEEVRMSSMRTIRCGCATGPIGIPMYYIIDSLFGHIISSSLLLLLVFPDSHHLTALIRHQTTTT